MKRVIDDRRKRRNDPADGDLADLSREELYERAQREEISGRSMMSRRG